MAEPGDERRPVEVELTPHEPSRTGVRTRLRRGRDATTPTAEERAVTNDDEPSVATVEAGDRPSLVADPLQRTVAIGVASAFVGLAIGYLLGSGLGGADSDSAAIDVPDTTAIDADAGLDGTRPADEGLEPIDTVRPTTTTRPPRTTTTTTVPPAVPIALHPAIAGTGARLVGVDSRSQLVEIDAASGTMTTRPVQGGLVDVFNLQIGADWIVTASPRSGTVQVITSDGEAEGRPIGDIWSLLPIPGTDRFWRFDDRTGPPTGPTDYVQIDLSGRPTGPVITSDGGWPAGADPAGGILHVVQGATYSVDAAGVALLGEGELLDLTEDVVVLRTCDERLVCGLSVVDRSTGDVRPAPVRERVVEGESFSFGASGVHSLAPDGSAIVVVGFGRNGARLSHVDLATGADVELTETTGVPVASWTADSRAVLFVDGDGVPMVFDRTTDAIEPLADGLANWRRVEVRPERSGD